jgi:hypothetical protein
MYNMWNTASIGTGKCGIAWRILSPTARPRGLDMDKVSRRKLGAQGNDYS